MMLNTTTKKQSGKDLFTNVNLFVNSVENPNTLTNVDCSSQAGYLVQNGSSVYLPCSVIVKRLQVENLSSLALTPTTVKQSREQPKSGFQSNILTASITSTNPLEKRSCTDKNILTNNYHDADTTKLHEFYCLCGLYFKNAKALKLHIMYYKKHRFECRFCLKRFPCLYNLKAHVLKIHWRHSFPKNDQRDSKSLQHTCITNREKLKSDQVSQTLETGDRVPPKQLSTTTTAILDNSSGRHGFHGRQPSNLYLCKCGMTFGNWSTLNSHIHYYPCFLSPSLISSNAVASLHERRLRNGCIKSSNETSHLGKVASANRKMHRLPIVNQYEPFVNNSACILRNKAICHTTVKPSNGINIGNWNNSTATYTSGASAFDSFLPASEPYFACHICGSRFSCCKLRSMHMVSQHQIPHNVQLANGTPYSNIMVRSNHHAGNCPLNMTVLYSNPYASTTANSRSNPFNVCNNQPTRIDSSIDVSTVSRNQTFKK